MPKAKYIPLFLVLFIAGGFFACDSNRVYEKNASIDGSGWASKDKIPFSFEIVDSLARYNFYFNFRHAGDYPYKNIYLFVQTKNPLGQLARDTAQMILADNKGRWLGKGIGDIYDYQFKFKEAVSFPASGLYEVKVEHAMRDPLLENVTDIGIRVEKINTSRGEN